MNDALRINFIFAGTTVDPLPAQSYLLSDNMGHFERASQRGADQETLHILSRVEFFELELRRFVGGTFKTLRRTLREVHSFVAFNQVYASATIELVINQMRRHLLENEWYELLPRLERAAVKINRKISESRS